MARTEFNGHCQIGTAEAVESLQNVIAATPNPSSVESNRFGGFTVQWNDEEATLLLNIENTGKWNTFIRTNIDSKPPVFGDPLDEIQRIVQSVVESNHPLV